MIYSKKTCLFVIVGLLAGLFIRYVGPVEPEKISRLGEYAGYSEARYDGSVRYSDYLTLSDGTKLAYDLILPTQDSSPADEPLPVLFKYTPYLRTFTIFDENGKNIMADLYQFTWVERLMLRVRYWIYDRGHLMDPLFRTKWLENMVYDGYAVFVVERPGTGASFGVMDPSFEIGAEEVDEILDWIATQPWSDGNIGMYGDSWQAQIQFAAASTGNKHLKTIFPVASSLDNYDSIIYPGGIYNKSFGTLFSSLNTMLEGLVTPVDKDVEGVLLAQAIETRSGSTVGKESRDMFGKYPFRDSQNVHQEKVWEEVFALYPMLDRINTANVPVYLVNGWFDLFTKDMMIWYANLTAPKRLIVLPFDHSEMEGENANFDIGIEAHRWFDYWLKGIDNGIMDEPPIHYYLMGTKKDTAWQTADQWPPTKNVKALFFAEGKTRSIGSANDGFLLETLDGSSTIVDIYRIDYSTTTGKFPRWSAINWPRKYPDMRTNDEKALTYTTSPLEADLQVIGHPVANIWLMTDAPDMDVFVYLEDVDRRGKSTYLTEGKLRASHRAQNKPPFNNLGLPYYRHYESDLKTTQPGEPMELHIDLLPTAYLFQKGHRIRVTIAFADADNFDTPIRNPTPVVQLLRDPAHPSSIDIPVQP